MILILVAGFSSQGKTFLKKTSVYFSNISNKEISKGNFWLPTGRETYQIAQAEGVDPKIYEATIDPPDVHVGDTQTLSIIVSSESGIKSVIAEIETDNGTTTLPLTYVRAVKDEELKPVSYEIGPDNKLTILKTPKSYAQNSLFPVAQAKTGEKVLYEGKWTVKDTHDRKYHTTFIATNNNGETNSITLAWSDACSITRSGAWNLASFGNCTISSPDGVDNGNVTIATYTLTLNSTFAFNPGQSITISSGAIAIGSGGSISQTNIWEYDQDSDFYGIGSFVDQSASPGAGYRRRYTVLGTDCDDINAQFYVIITVFADTDGDGYGAGGAVQACTNGGAPAGYAENDWDCDSSNNRLWQILPGPWEDDDHDGWYGSTPVEKCVGGSDVINGRTYWDGGSMIGCYGPYQYYNQGVTSGSDLDDCNPLVGGGSTGMLDTGAYTNLSFLAPMIHNFSALLTKIN